MACICIWMLVKVLRNHVSLKWIWLHFPPENPFALATALSNVPGKQHKHKLELSHTRPALRGRYPTIWWCIGVATLAWGDYSSSGRRIGGSRSRGVEGGCVNRLKQKIIKSLHNCVRRKFLPFNIALVLINFSIKLWFQIIYVTILWMANLQSIRSVSSLSFLTFSWIPVWAKI